MHVLIVDDDLNMRRTLRDIFEEEGFEASTAESGEQAVSMCLEHDYDVVVMDVRMPGIDGLAAFREMRKRDCAVPVVMMSGYSVEHLIDEALAEGVVAFVQKPLDAAKVLFLIRSVARGGKVKLSHTPLRGKA